MLLECGFVFLREGWKDVEGGGGDLVSENNIIFAFF